ncbi:MAG TPA: hypothetical protein VM221_05535 [Armatimonadota bacterium]|nr:hypothetical protein [Armatimonadota bacterium]
MIIAVDLDGCLATYAGWKGHEDIGDPLPGALDAMHTLHADGHQLFIFTCRCCEVPLIGADGAGAPYDLPNPATLPGAAEAIKAWLQRHRFPPMQVWTGPGKPFADIYIDDRAMRVAPQENEGHWPRAVAAIQLFEIVAGEPQKGGE